MIKNTYQILGLPYPKSHEIDWNDQEVYKDMLRSPVALFQFENGNFAFDSLKKFKPTSVFDISLVTAAIRPSGASYRNDLLERKQHHNPSPMIDELLKENLGYLIYQCDIIAWLQQICGLPGSTADSVRRSIAHKDLDALQKIMPQILDGYCSKSDKPRPQAEEEAKEFLQIIEDASSYMFGKNHALGYSMLTYLCAYLRYYHPAEFITAYLDNADNEDDIKNGTELAGLYKINIVPPRYGLSKNRYIYDKEAGVIAKGIESVKFMNSSVANELYDIAHNDAPATFMDLLGLMRDKSSINSRQREILIKIDFFKDFGNMRELMRMLSIFTLFKEGKAKKMAKDKLTPDLLPIVAKYGTDKNKDGNKAKFYTITDMPGLLAECEATIKWGTQHITMLRFVDLSFSVYGLHRAGQDDIDAHAMRMNNRIIRSSTRLADFSQGEVSDFYKDKIIPTDVALAYLGITTPDEIEYEGRTYVRAANGYIVKGMENNKDAKRGLYMLSIPSNFIFRMQLTEFAHLYKERNIKGGANPEVKEVAESAADQVNKATLGYANRDILMKIDVANDDFGAICNCAVRYACGRMSYMPGLVINFLTPLIPHLNNKTLWCFDQDLTEQKYEGRGYGDPQIDEPGWHRFHEAVRAERTKRGEALYKSWREA